MFQESLTKNYGHSDNYSSMPVGIRLAKNSYHLRGDHRYGGKPDLHHGRRSWTVLPLLERDSTRLPDRRVLEFDVRRTGRVCVVGSRCRPCHLLLRPYQSVRAIRMAVSKHLLHRYLRLLALHDEHLMGHCSSYGLSEIAFYLTQ